MSIANRSCISDEKTIEDVPGDPFDYFGACQFNEGNILSDSCQGLEACSGNAADILSESCIGVTAW